MTWRRWCSRRWLHQRGNRQQHHLLIGHRLLDRLIDRGAGFLHYDLRIHLDSNARYEVRRAAQASA
jgi:hypothetical protein